MLIISPQFWIHLSFRTFISAAFLILLVSSAIFCAVPQVVLAQTNAQPTSDSPFTFKPSETSTPALQRLLGNTTQSAVGASSASSQNKGGKTSQNLNSEPLAPEQAFVLSARREGKSVRFTFEIAQGYYLYREKILLETEGTLLLASTQLPKGEWKYDDTFAKNVETFRKRLEFSWKLSPAETGKQIRFIVYSQGCADIGICYPPQAQLVSFDVNQSAASISATVWREPANATRQKQPVSLTSGSPTNETINLTLPQKQTNLDLNQSLPKPSAKTQAQIPSKFNQPAATDYQKLFTDGNLWLLSLSFFGFGLLLSFTPCVLPMVPIVASIVVGSVTQGGVNRKKTFAWLGFSLSAAYVLGMAIVFTGLGVAAGLLGSSLTVALQQPVALIIFALLLIVLACSQFGWYELRLPSGWINRISQINPLKSKSTKQDLQDSKGMNNGHVKESESSLLGAATLGALSALMIGPCITAPLAAALAYIAQTGQAISGGIALFCLAIGMGIPLLLIGLGGARFLPKAGAWMVQIQLVFGLLLLGMALWTVQSLLSSALLVLLTALLLIVLGLTSLDLATPRQSTQANQNYGLGIEVKLEGIKENLSNAQLLMQRGVKALVWMLFVWVFAMLVGGAGGHWSVLQPLDKVTGGAGGIYGANNLASESKARVVKFERVSSLTELEQRLKQVQGRGVLLDFYADWCVSCIEFEKFTFSDPKVAESMSQWTLLQVDVTKNTAQDQEVLKKFGMFGPPTIVFFDTTGQEIQGARVVGFLSAMPFLAHLKQLKP